MRGTPWIIAQRTTAKNNAHKTDALPLFMVRFSP